jgi:hypothetical protein
MLVLQNILIGGGLIVAYWEYNQWKNRIKFDEVRKFKKLFWLLIKTNQDLFDKAAEAYRGELPNWLSKEFLEEQNFILAEFNKFIREHFLIYPKLQSFFIQNITKDIREIRDEIDRVSDAIKSEQKDFALRILETNFNEKQKNIYLILESEKDRLMNYFKEEID